MKKVSLRVATRGSALARWQAERVLELLGGDGELVVVVTSGDQQSDVPLHTIGGTGVFVKEVQEAVLDGRAEVAVHSAKDLPADTPDGLVLAAFPERADPRDALVGSALDALPSGAVVATGSVRRRAQLAARRFDLGFAELRGNMQTRLDKAADFDAIVVAAAALDRLGLADRIASRLSFADMLPQVGQGALGVECRTDDDATRARLAEIDDADVRDAVTAERAFLGRLGSGCSLPVAAHARIVTGGDGAGTESTGRTVAIEGLVASYDGARVSRAAMTGTDPAAVGELLADALQQTFGEVT
jgi:hydroxymethylbilane synthase